MRRSRSTAQKRKLPDGWPPPTRLLTCRGTRSTLGPPMPRRGCPSTAPSTGCARSTATNPGTTNCAPKPSITAARPCTPTLRTIQGCSDDDAVARFDGRPEGSDPTDGFVRSRGSRLPSPRGRRAPHARAGSRRRPRGGRACAGCFGRAPRRSFASRRARSRSRGRSFPAAIRTRTSRSRGVSSPRGSRAAGAATSSATSDGSTTVPPAATRCSASRNSFTSVIRSLRRYPDPLRGPRHELQRVLDVDVLGENHRAHVRERVANLLRCNETLVRERRRHADVDDGDVRGIGGDEPDELLAGIRPGREPRLRARREAARCPPGRRRRRRRGSRAWDDCRYPRAAVRLASRPPGGRRAPRRDRGDRGGRFPLHRLRRRRRL